MLWCVNAAFGSALVGTDKASSRCNMAPSSVSRVDVISLVEEGDENWTSYWCFAVGNDG